ncbi:MAG: NAD-dependent epimerase/dehydratase family protein [Candidatus Hodarchaeota archaeon]
MNILITGAFGNIGKAVIDEAHKRNHGITVFELDNRRNRKIAEKYRKQVDSIILGDIRDYESVLDAVKTCDAIIHMAAIIPPLSKRNRDLCIDVNLGGTINIVNAINQVNRNIPLIFCSSASVMGPTQHLNRLITPDDPLVITENYEESKIKAEEFLEENADNYLIFRLAGVLPLQSTDLFSQFKLFEEIFSIHPDARLEMIIDLDVAVAFINAIEKLQNVEIPNNRAYLLGGGKENGFQITGEDLISRLVGSLSLPRPDRKYFTADLNSYHLDWYDTEEVQQRFNFQNYALEDYFNHLKHRYSRFKIFIRIFKPLILKKFISMSPYNGKTTENSGN